MTWQVCELVPNTSFDWFARSAVCASRPGICSRTTRRRDEGDARVHHSGPLAGVVGVRTRSRTRRCTGLEAAGLKAAAEARGRPGGAAADHAEPPRTPTTGPETVRDDVDGPDR